MTAAAIYARYSTDRQDRSSIEDQVRTCRAWSEARGLDLVATYADEATSGSVPVRARPGGAAMHDAALDGAFAVLVVESLDRISRDQVDGEQVVRRLEHAGVRIVGVSDGYDSAAGASRFVLRGIRGVVNESYRRDLVPKIRRGLAGQVARGFHAGGLSYGYRSVATAVGARGEPADFRLEIVPEQAAIVREIFDRFGRGESLQRIAADLNARGVPGPGRKRGRASTWSVSALYGTPRDGSGLVNNPIYRGRYVWNRREWIRDPDDPTRRVPRMRPPAEWQIAERPELRIVSDAAWDAAAARIGAGRDDRGRARSGPKPRTLFGGLLRCGACGGPVIAVSATAYGCAARKDRGPAVCRGVRAPRAVTDRRLVAEIRAQVLAPAAVQAIADRVGRIIADARRRSSAADKARQARRIDLRGEIDRLADAVAQVGLSAALRARLAAAERELAALEDGARMPAPAPNAREVVREIRETAAQLETALAGDVERARAMLADRLGPIVIDERDGDVWARTRLGPALLIAGGADSVRGCGGAIREIESAAECAVRLAPTPGRRAA